MEKIIKEKLENFQNIREKSPMCRLLLKERKDVYTTFEGVEVCSIAFWAFYKGYINDIDAILEKFKIEEKSTKAFKGNLEERWLDEVDDKKRNLLFNRTLSSLAELIVADYSSLNGEVITQLSALDIKCPVDIVAYMKESGKEYFTEVKYFGKIPDWHQLDLDAIRAERFISRWVSSPTKMYNYFIIRIADAVKQLEKAEIPLDKRRVFLVIDSSSRDILENSVIYGLRNKDDWMFGKQLDSLILELDLSEQQKRSYFSKSAETYINNSNEIIISFLDKYNLEVLNTITHSYK